MVDSLLDVFAEAYHPYATDYVALVGGHLKSAQCISVEDWISTLNTIPIVIDTRGLVINTLRLNILKAAIEMVCFRPHCRRK